MCVTAQQIMNRGLVPRCQVTTHHRRRDLFDRYKLSVPVTWEDYVQLAERMNGTDVDGDGKADLYGTCFDIHPDICKANFILIAMVAPYIQYRGTSQGVFYDPDTMEPLINNAAMLRVLDLYTRLFAVQPQTPTCAASNIAFRNRTCLMTINWGAFFCKKKRQDHLACAIARCFATTCARGQKRISDIPVKRPNSGSPQEIPHSNKQRAVSVTCSECPRSRTSLNAKNHQAIVSDAIRTTRVYNTNHRLQIFPSRSGTSCLVMSSASHTNRV